MIRINPGSKGMRMQLQAAAIELAPGTVLPLLVQWTPIGLLQ